MSNNESLEDHPLILPRILAIGLIMKSLRVLLADPNRHSRAVTRKVLDNLGIKSVREASSGAEVLEKLALLPTDLVLCELEMQPIDGVELVARIRTGAESPNPYLPIIAVTSAIDLGRIRAVRDAGVHEILAKPISTKAMSDRIADAVFNPRPFLRSETYFGPSRRPAPGTQRGAPALALAS